MSKSTQAQIAALIEDVEWLLSWDCSPEHIARRLGRTTTGIHRALLRHGRSDLAAPFNAEYQRQKAAEYRARRKVAA